MHAKRSARLIRLHFVLIAVGIAIGAPDKAAEAQPIPSAFVDVGPERLRSDRFAGTATLEVPIVVPPGTAGAEPEIVLRYDSATVDLRGNRDQAQPTGLGWTLSSGGYIFRDDKRTLSTGDDTFVLIFRGVRHTLVLVNSGDRIYHTKDETFWRIQYQPSGSGDEWTLTTETGVRYRFGSSDNSRAYALNADGTGLITYKYLLSEHSTPNGPTVRYVYFKQSAGANGFTYDQAVYPDTITYSYATPESTTPVGGTTRQVKFVLEQSRRDYTASAGQSFHERYLIRSVEVTVGTALVRKYVFEYDYSIDRDTSYTWGGGATGDLTLKSITQYGADGLSALPALRFQYSSSRLSRFDNGIGGAITFGYERVRTVPLYRVCGVRGHVTPFQNHPLYFHPVNCEWMPSLTPGSTYDHTYLLGHILTTPQPGTVPLYKVCVLYSSGCRDWDVRTTPDQWGLSTLLGYGNAVAVPGTKTLYTGQTCYSSYPCRWMPSDSEGGNSILLAEIYAASVDVYRVATRTVSDGRRDPATTTFQYEGLSLAGDRRERRGHHRVRAISPAAHYTDTYFHLEEALLGRVSRVQVFEQNGPVTGSEPLFDRTDYQWAVVSNPDFPGTTFAALTQVDGYTYDGDATAKQMRVTYTHDAWGNPTDAEYHGDVAEPGDERTISTHYFPNEDDWIIALPAYRAVSAGIGAGATTLAATWFMYDDATSHSTPPTVGNLRERHDWLDGGQNPVTSWTYDAYGNVLSHTNPRGFTTDIRYDETATFPATVTTPPVGNPPVRLLTTYTYDASFGVLRMVVDPNARRTEYHHDAFGRLERVVNALGQQTRIAYEDLGTVGSQRITVRVPDEAGSPDGIWRSDYFDGLGRTFETQAESTTAGTPVVHGVEYDARGLVASESLPRFLGAAVQWTTFTYDAMGRLVRQTLPDSSFQEWTYNDWATAVRNLRGFTWTYVHDAYGRIVKVIEPGSPAPETIYTYDVLDRPVTVRDALLKSTSIQYDTLSRRRVLDDPALGLRTYAYDLNGNLIAQTDAKAQLLSFEYDALDRLVRKVYPDGRRIVLTYDAGVDALGRLTRAAELDSLNALTSANEYEYDPLGRVKTVIRTVDNTSYVTRFEYTPFDALKYLTYPDGERLTYDYDTAGRVNSVVGVQDSIPTTYLESATYNAAGQPTQLRRHGNVITDRTFSPTRLWLDAVRSSASTATLQDLVFGRDPAGNIVSVQDNVNRAFDQTFQYDALDRLTQAVGPYGTHAYTYDVVGNLLSKAGVTYGYGVTAHGCGRPIPYAVASTSYGFAGSYDCNGNLLGDGERTFVWDHDDRPTAITHVALGTTTFVYGPDGARLRKATASKTIRYAGWFEDRVEDNVLVKHVFAAGYRIATRASGGPAAGVYVPLGDHLGSLHALVQGSTVVLRQAYLPFGETDPTQSSGSADWYQHRFTDQEQDPETELYYYGARYYNPKLGRFISPDPIVPSAFNPQSLNRYTYVLNNPVRYTDPTGHGECCASDDEGARNEERGYGESHGGVGSGDGGGGLGVSSHLDIPDMTLTAEVSVNPYGDMDGPYSAYDPYGDFDVGSSGASDSPPSVPGTQLAQVWRNPTTRPELTPGLAGGPPRFNGPPRYSGPPAGTPPTRPSTLEPGPYSKGGIPARGPQRNFTQEERAKINELGRKHGCHTCGTSNPGTKSGNFVPDHQPPSALNREGAPQDLMPHCAGCSATQGGQVRGVLNK